MDKPKKKFKETNKQIKKEILCKVHVSLDELKYNHNTMTYYTT